MCKWPLDCAPIFSYALKLSFCTIYLPILHAVFVKGKDTQRSWTKTIAYMYVIAKGLGLRLYAVKEVSFKN